MATRMLTPGYHIWDISEKFRVFKSVTSNPHSHHHALHMNPVYLQRIMDKHRVFGQDLSQGLD
ncbi:uncharacterized protein FOMMEDRAFT_153122 [Fomitiporia mediterranea MF3/22]|uniref:uncharacterized protein n=1 Tax=Fomitiporia mediterranea (strain MF3/22) TaxID=694068 RepID=UPI0004409699|nr:uncharacterized protein FOMMEDRAFT_153122 [Fomitiporia mediterranea MF3/22]EJD05780.1 hypothetical protein FOMMEDRAFT_153122 [Fomitiporia mediterranea MF3/22]